MSTLAAPAATLAPTIPETERELGGILVPRRGQHAMVRGEGCWHLGRRGAPVSRPHRVLRRGAARPRASGAARRRSTTQAGRLIALSSNFFNDRRAELLALLKARLPEHFAHFFLCNSGTEANEAALKFAFLANRRTGLGRAQARASTAARWARSPPPGTRASARPSRRCSRPRPSSTPATSTGSTAPSATRPRRSSPR